MVGSNKRAGKKKARAKAVVQRMRAPRRQLDAKAYEYARLLSDPCAAPLTHPVYSGGDSGFLFRAESVTTIGTLSTETSGYLHWTPGYVNTNNTELVFGASAGPGTAVAAGSGNTTPGKVFLGGNASAARCVAACLKVTYPGAESSRSGRVHFGVTAAGLIDAGDSISVDNLAPVLQHFTRTPPETIELMWRPGVADQEFNDPRAASSPTLRDRKSSLTVAWAGLPGSTGMTFQFTAIYEWVPAAGQGISTNASGKNTSRNTLDDVIDYVQASGFNWVRSASHAAGVGLGAGLISGISNTFGIMPARQMGHGRQRIAM